MQIDLGYTLRLTWNVKCLKGLASRDLPLTTFVDGRLRPNEGNEI